MSTLSYVITAAPDSPDLWAEVATAEEYFAGVSLERDGRFVLTFFRESGAPSLTVDWASFQTVVERACRRLGEMYPERRPQA